MSSEIVKEPDWIFSETLQLQATVEVCTEGEAGCICLAGWEVEDDESWKLVISGTRRKTCALPEYL